ncbi:MAG: T9SS type A sorting domain-containing protein [Candidatus Kapaibacterium sp.]
MDKHKMVYKTDQNGNIISTHSMGWSQEKEEWNSVYRDSVIFDEYENVDSTYLYIWNDEKEEWIDYQVYFHENTYENGHLTERIVNLATDTGGRPVSKSYFTYYQDSLASEEHYQFSGEYKKARKTTYEYDEHMNLITETTYLPNSEDEWEPKERFRHIYSSVTSVAQQPAETARARIYPNPASDALKYEIAAGEFGEYAIKDIAGRTVARGPIATPQGEIDIRGLAPGVYFIRFISDINIYNLKFVKSE